KLGEAATFHELICAVADPDPSQATFYAHTKGVTAPRPRACSAHWRDTMYRGRLDNFDLGKAALSHDSSAGCFRMRTLPCRYEPPSRPRWGPWVFAGSFYWFRNDRVFGNPYWERNVPWGAENVSEWFPYLAMPIGESFCLFYDEFVGAAEGDPMSFGPYCD